MFNYFLIFFLIFSFFLIYFSKKYNLFVDFKMENHKRFSSNLKSYSIGGILLITFFAYYFILEEKNYLLFVFLFSIFLIGLFSDLKKLNSVNLRFLFQIVTIIFFIYFIHLKINFTRIDSFDAILQQNIFINIFFTAFCLLVLINGSNFIDGLNGLILKYNLIIYLILFYGFPNEFFQIDIQVLKYLIIILFLILILNLLGFLYMGDSGAYLISLFTGIFLINFSSENIFISPYLVILLLWYPCFELLFSMGRRYLKATKTYKPDNFHLHQLIYSFVKKKLNFKNNLIIHFLTSSTINLYNLGIFLVGLNSIYDSKIIIYLIIFNLVIYTSFYKIFYKFHKLKN